jgi:putative ABC transport system permease protein
MEIVGVAGDIKYSGLDAPPEPTYYLPYRQNPWNRQFVVVRTAADAGSVASAARQAVTELDKDVPISRVKTMEDLMTASVAPPKFRTVLVAMFALAGLLLAAVGLYGVISYAVSERTHELGVRIALGADRGDVVRLVLAEAMTMAVAGILVGLAGAFATTRLMQSLLFGVTSTDAATFAGISVLLLLTALAASYLPTRRATRVDPMIALRYE